jgi:hypothetical protein
MSITTLKIYLKIYIIIIICSNYISVHLCWQWKIGTPSIFPWQTLTVMILSHLAIIPICNTTNHVITPTSTKRTCRETQRNIPHHQGWKLINTVHIIPLSWTLSMQVTVFINETAYLNILWIHLSCSFSFEVPSFGECGEQTCSHWWW